jgi:hypothetical protein
MAYPQLASPRVKRPRRTQHAWCHSRWRPISAPTGVRSSPRGSPRHDAHTGQQDPDYLMAKWNGDEKGWTSLARKGGALVGDNSEQVLRTQARLGVWQYTKMRKGLPGGWLTEGGARRQCGDGMGLLQWLGCSGLDSTSYAKLGQRSGTCTHGNTRS